MPIFIATLITIAKILKQPKYTFSLTHIQWNIALPFATMWMNIDEIMISDVLWMERGLDHLFAPLITSRCVDFFRV